MTDFDEFAGVPWEPHPRAKGGFESRSNVLPADGEEVEESF